MLTNKPVNPTLPAVDLKRARQFYEEKLGLKVVIDDPIVGLMLMAGENTYLYLYQRAATKAEHTVAQFHVDDLAAEVKELQSKGITFEEYDIPEMGLKTMNGIAKMSSPEGEIKGAWFKDTEGNILALVELSANLKQKVSSKVAGAKI